MQVGDQVVVLDPRDGPEILLEKVGVSDQMLDMVGKEYFISGTEPSIGIEGLTLYRLDGNGSWVWAPDWLQPVGEESLFDDEAFDEIFE